MFEEEIVRGLPLFLSVNPLEFTDDPRNPVNVLAARIGGLAIQRVMNDAAVKLSPEHFVMLHDRFASKIPVEKMAEEEGVSLGDLHKQLDTAKEAIAAALGFNGRMTDEALGILFEVITFEIVPVPEPEKVVSRQEDVHRPKCRHPLFRYRPLVA